YDLGQFHDRVVYVNVAAVEEMDTVVTDKCLDVWLKFLRRVRLRETLLKNGHHCFSAFPRQPDLFLDPFGLQSARRKQADKNVTLLYRILEACWKPNRGI